MRSEREQTFLGPTRGLAHSLEEGDEVSVRLEPGSSAFRTQIEVANVSHPLMRDCRQPRRSSRACVRERQKAASCAKVFAMRGLPPPSPSLGDDLGRIGESPTELAAVCTHGLRQPGAGPGEPGSLSASVYDCQRRPGTSRTD